MKSPQCVFSLVLVAVVLSWQNGCARQSERDPVEATNALVVCPGAIEPKRTNVEGGEQLMYRAVAEYPANEIIACISERLEKARWQPLKDDFWNPGLPSSHVRGWTHFVDSIVHPEATVDQWSGQWTNATGDVAWYTLQYVYPPGDRHTLNIYAGYIPAGMAKKVPKTPGTPTR